VITEGRTARTPLEPVTAGQPKAMPQTTQRPGTLCYTKDGGSGVVITWRRDRSTLNRTVNRAEFPGGYEPVHKSLAGSRQQRFQLR
jgi:hypothetical protein